MKKIYLLFIPLILILLFSAFRLSSKDSGKSEEKCDSGKCDISSESEVKGSANSFLGKEGDLVYAENNSIYLSENELDEQGINYFHYGSEEDNKDIYFFVIKASDGTYRVAANACEVCFGDKMGFSQVGDKIQCDACKTTYSKDQIALEKGGCNPAPIDSNPEVVDGKVKIALSAIESVSYLF